MKKIILSILIALMTLSLAFGFGCDDDGNKNGNNTTSQDVVELSLDKTQLAMTLGDSVMISAETSKTEGYSLVWSSNNEQVATVIGGNVQAISLGNATITAKYTNGTDSVEKTVDVSVSSNNMAAVLDIGDEEDSWRIRAGEEFPILPKVTFNGKIFTNGITLTAKYYDQTVLAVENNVIKGKEIGKTKITFEASFGGLTAGDAQPLLIRTIDVEVFEDCQIFLNGEGVVDVELFNVDEFNGQQFANKMPFELKATRNGVLSENPVTATIEDENVVEIVAGELVAKTYGKTSITLVWQEDDLREERNFDVVVNCPSIDDEVEFDVSSGILDLSGISFFNGKNIVSIRKDGVYDGNLYASNKLNLEQTDVKIKKDKSDVEYLPIVIGLGNNEFYRLANFKAYSKVFTQANSAEIATTFASNTNATNSGYYILKENITGVSFNAKIATLNTFDGVFDGRGYTISMSVVGYGLFGYYEEGATVKNVAFEMDFGTPTWNTFGLFYIPKVKDTTPNATLENIYIKVKEITETKEQWEGQNNGFQLTYVAPIAQSNNTPWKITNVFTEMSVADSIVVNGSWCGSAMVVENFYSSNVSNFYTISTHTTLNAVNSFALYGAVQMPNAPVKDYEDRAAMIEANRDYTDFANSGYWTVVAGEIPVWKTFPV